MIFGPGLRGPHESTVRRDDPAKICGVFRFTAKICAKILRCGTFWSGVTETFAAFYKAWNP